MTDSPYNYKTIGWKDKPIISAIQKYKSAHSRSTLKKTDFSENRLSRFTLKLIGQDA